MLGVVLAVASALCWSVLDTLRKVMGRSLHPLVSTTLITIGAGLLFFVGLLWKPVAAAPVGMFWVAVWISVAVGIAANLLFFRAVQVSPLSLTIPYLGFTPVFMLGSGALMLGEVPGWMGLSGVFTVIVGAILLNPAKDGRFAPFRALRHERGSLYMLAVAFLWSLSVPFEKIALVKGNLFLFGGCVNSFVGLLLLGYLALFRRDLLGSLVTGLRLGLLAAFTQAIALLTQYLALPLIFVVYVDTIKRSGAIFAVLIGYIFFGERPLRPRLLGASVIVAGVALIILGQT